MKGKNWLFKVGLWPSPMHPPLHITHTHNLHINLQKFKVDGNQPMVIKIQKTKKPPPPKKNPLLIHNDLGWSYTLITFLFSHPNLGIIGREEYWPRNCLYQTGLWACMWGYVLDCWLLWEGGIHCGQYHAWAGVPELHKKGNWASQREGSKKQLSSGVFVSVPWQKLWLPSMIDHDIESK